MGTSQRRASDEHFRQHHEQDFHHHPSAQAPGAAPTPAQQAPTGDTATITAPAQTAAPQTVDVGAVLSEMASMKGGGGNYQSSIVDLLKLLDLDFEPRRTQGAGQRA